MRIIHRIARYIGHKRKPIEISSRVSGVAYFYRRVRLLPGADVAGVSFVFCSVEMEPEGARLEDCLIHPKP